MVVVGFFKRYLRKFVKHYPDAPVMPGLRKTEKIKKVLEQFPNARAFNTHCKNVTPEMVREAHRHGVMVFTNVLAVKRAKERDYMRHVIECGSDAIQFDHRPYAWRRAAEKHFIGSGQLLEAKVIVSHLNADMVGQFSQDGQADTGQDFPSRWT